jgi:hypothetical protein
MTQRVIKIAPYTVAQVQEVRLVNIGDTPLYVREGPNSFKVSRRPPANYGVKKCRA